MSSKRWEPIFNVRGRPAWVQTTVFDLMKELKILKLGHITLPGIDIVKIPSHRQLVVPYGDMDALCDSIVSSLLSCSETIAKRHLILRSPGIRFREIRRARCGIWRARRQSHTVDQLLQGMQAETIQGTKSNDSQKLAEDQGPNTQLQFVIWITSLRMPSIAFEEGVKSVYDQVGGPTRALKASLRNYQWQVPLTQVNREQSKRQNRRKGEKHPLVLNVKVALLYVVIIV